MNLSKNDLIGLIVFLLLGAMLLIGGIYASYKTDRAALEMGLEECQIDFSTHQTIWVRDCTDHLTTVKEMEK